MCRVSFGVMVLVLGLRKRPYAACFAFVCMVCFWEPDLGGCEQSGRSSVLPGLDYRARRPYRYVRIHSTVASLCPARSHTSGTTGIHPKEKPQGRREKPRPSYYPQSGGLDETHYQLHQDHQASRQTRLFVARHASSSTITSDCDIAGGCPQLRRHNRLLRNERRGRWWRARQGILQNLISNHVSRVRLLIATHDVLPTVLVALVDKKLRPLCRWRA